ncbi:tail fiber like-protein [Vibrio fluvialis]|uniref:Tail fiber like-protein n=1 Tax=Vibrio fluvialis TaxID=676 RepID=A0AAX2LVQ0_VIBFL|nr:hypothetical protein [Vibrio fluvialis]MCE7635604.1 hypothetical protein [Vibrio fluvialis]SUQ27227.1 tail fiber like-protein [Vibrio fluvialis]
MSLLITHAGIAAAIRAGDLGIEYKITHISIGSAGYVPNPEQTALVAEIQKKALTRGALVAQGQLHFETVWDGEEEFEGKELGYWLEDGTLFAVDSRDGEVITYKRKNTVVTEACELNLAASTIENITVEMLGSPYATEQVAGIAKIVSNGQVDSENDDNAILTVTKALRLMARRISSATTGTRTDVAASEKVVGVLSQALADIMDDTRWTNARDWTAETVSQAEAEEGTSSTPRKWTSERVHQAFNQYGVGGGAPSISDANQQLVGRVNTLVSPWSNSPVQGNAALMCFGESAGVNLQIHALHGSGIMHCRFRTGSAGTTPWFMVWDDRKKASISDARNGTKNLYPDTSVLNSFLKETTIGSSDQSWGDYTSSRLSGVTYTNNTTRPIMVSITSNEDAATSGMIKVDGLAIAVFGDSAGDVATTSFIVPSGSTYSVVFNANATTIWSELR